MKVKVLAVLAAALIAGCGGGDDSDDNEPASTAPATAPSTTPSADKEANAPQKLKGPPNEANVKKALGLEGSGDAYSFGGGPCKITGFAFNKNGVDELVDSADPKENVIKNDSGTAAVELEELNYFCAIQAANRLKNIP